MELPAYYAIRKFLGSKNTIRYIFFGAIIILIILFIVFFIRKDNDNDKSPKDNISLTTFDGGNVQVTDYNDEIEILKDNLNGENDGSDGIAAVEAIGLEPVVNKRDFHSPEILDEIKDVFFATDEAYGGQLNKLLDLGVQPETVEMLKAAKINQMTAQRIKGESCSQEKILQDMMFNLGITFSDYDKRHWSRCTVGAGVLLQTI